MRGAGDIDSYREAFLADPKAFVSGARTLCKQAGAAETWDAVKPWLLALAIGYGGLKLGSGWGRYAEHTKNPNGPVVGPFMSAMNVLLPTTERIYWMGQPGYGKAKAFDDAAYLARRSAIMGESPPTTPKVEAGNAQG